MRQLHEFCIVQTNVQVQDKDKKEKEGDSSGAHPRVRSPTVEDTRHVLAWPGYLCSLGTQRRMTTWNSSLSIP